MSCSETAAGPSKQWVRVLMLVNGVGVQGSEIEMEVGAAPVTGSKTRILKLKALDVVTFEIRSQGNPKPTVKIPIRRANCDVKMLRWW